MQKNKRCLTRGRVLQLGLMSLPCEGPSSTRRSLSWCPFGRRCPLWRPCGAGCRRALRRRRRRERPLQHAASGVKHSSGRFARSPCGVTRSATFLLPWHRSTYSGRFLRAVCTTSKLPLPMQYINVGRKSAARLQQRKQALLICRITSHFLALPSGACLSPRAADLRRIVLHAAQRQAEGHVATQLLGRSHESLQVVLQTVTHGGEWRVRSPADATLHLLFLVTHDEVLDDFWVPPRLLIHLR